MILTNELPEFKDASGVIANQFLTLRMIESFLGSEDLDLASRLRGQLAPVFNWSLEGLDRLNRNGRFTMPPSSSDAAAVIADLASPVAAFIRDHCIRDPAATVTADDLYAEW